MRLGVVYHMPFWRDANGRLCEAEGSFARYVDSLAPYFDEVVVCAPLAQGRRDGTMVRAGNVTLAPLPWFDGPKHFYPRLVSALPAIFGFVRRVDVLHCRVPTPPAIFAFAAARLVGRPVFLLVVGDLQALRDTMPYRGLKRAAWRLYTAFEEWAVQWMADRSLTFANGEALARKHERPGHPVVETRTTTIAASDITGREDCCAGPRVRLLTVSRIDPRKGLGILPDVVRTLIDGGFDVELDIVGPPVGAPGEAEQREITRRAIASGVGDRIRLLGGIALDRLLPLYRDYDFFVLPTLPGEGVPRVLLEAMTAGVPVVTTRVAGIPSLVTHEVNGLLVDVPTAAAIADALRRLMTDAPLRRRLIANGFTTARAHTLEAQAASMMREVSARMNVTLRQPLLAEPRP